MPGDGEHEVVVCSARHVGSWHELDDEEETRRWSSRWDAPRTSRRAAHVVGWCNVGQAARASQPHLHRQVLSSPVPLPVLAAEACALRAGCSVLCDDGPTERLVATDGPLRAAMPFAPAADHEVVVTACEHRPFPTDAGRLGRFVRDLCGRLARVADASGVPPSYRLAMHHTSHWHLHIQPRLADHGGPELGSGLWMVRDDPETAAARLRCW